MYVGFRVSISHMKLGPDISPIAPLSHVSGLRSPTGGGCNSLFILFSSCHLEPISDIFLKIFALTHFLFSDW